VGLDAGTDPVCVVRSHQEVTVKRVRQPSDVPEGPHTAVLVYKTTSTYVPGDERSRTNPGHGYPGGYDIHDSFEHYVSTNDADVVEFLRKLELPEFSAPKVPYVVLDVESKLKPQISLNLTRSIPRKP
jgi:hypothetical protein